jgi:hypothetical protein
MKSEYISKGEARKLLRSLEKSLANSGREDTEKVVQFHTILNSLQCSGFWVRPFFMPPFALNRDMLRVHILACIHHLKKANPKAA